jgi:hypothetical protein
VISRQKIVGWVLIIVSVAYIAYFLRVRLFAPGPMIEKKEWVHRNVRDIDAGHHQCPPCGDA